MRYKIDDEKHVTYIPMSPERVLSILNAVGGILRDNPFDSKGNCRSAINELIELIENEPENKVIRNDEVDYPIQEVGELNHLYKINELYVFVSEDEKGEGVCGIEAVFGGRPMMLTMVAADKARLDSLMKHAKNLARGGNKKIKLIKLSHREELQEITGE